MKPHRHEQCELAIKPMLQILNYRTFTIGCTHKDLAMITHNPVDGAAMVSLFLDGVIAEVRCFCDGRIVLDVIPNEREK